MKRTTLVILLTSERVSYAFKIICETGDATYKNNKTQLYKKSFLTPKWLLNPLF